jgi:hypothetical protein
MNSAFDTAAFIFTWYCLVAILIAFFLRFFKFINMPAWRDDHGDRTSEVGYFEDSAGRIVANPFNDQGHEEGSVDPPHVQNSS